MASDQDFVDFIVEVTRRNREYDAAGVSTTIERIHNLLSEYESIS